MITLRLGQGDLEYLKVSVSEPQLRPEGEDEPRDYWDDNWIDVAIEIRVGAFDGRYTTQLHGDEFHYLREQLPKLYSFEIHKIEFSAMEGQLFINIEGDRRGNFAARCEARDRGDGNSLRFTVGFDQTQIPRMIHELDAIIKTYRLPARKKTQ
jgi:hypothetical protein